MNTMTADPAASMKLWADMMRMSFEAQYVMGMRLAAMAGVLPQRRGENYRMVAEKGDAARESVGPPCGWPPGARGPTRSWPLRCGPMASARGPMPGGSACAERAFRARIGRPAGMRGQGRDCLHP